MSREDLKQLPVRVIKAKLAGQPGKTVEVLVDGDYDGEWFASLPWRTQNKGVQFVVLAASRNSRLYRIFGKSVYLHHLILPPKEGHRVTHLNGDKLDNRSCNLAYITEQEIARRREDKKRIDNFKAMQYRLNKPRKEEPMDENEGTADHPDITEPRS